MYRFEVRQLVVISIYAHTEEQASISSINDLVVTELCTNGTNISPWMYLEITQYILPQSLTDISGREEPLACELHLATEPEIPEFNEPNDP